MRLKPLRSVPWLTATLALILVATAACQPIQPDLNSPASIPVGSARALTIIPAAGPDAPAPVTPTNLAIPAIEMSVPVTVMGWEIVESEGSRTTRWTVPLDSAGWHADSAVPGEPGVAIISGRQTGGDAVFAPIALGDVEAGQEIDVTLSDGSQAHYVIREVSQPIPLQGASVDEEAAVAGYLSTGDAPRLVLVTGWPEFTTTHRIFVIAEESPA